MSMPAGWIVPDWPAPGRIRSVVTTRSGGVSPPPWASLNLGDHVGDDPAAVAQNRGRLRDFLPAEPCWLEQVHGTAVVRTDTGAERRGDAAVSRTPGVVCAVLTADCLPVLLCDEDASVVAAVHAGWRGLCAGVLERAAEACSCPPGKLLAWLGPAIGPERFEVGPEVRAAFLAHDPLAADAFAQLPQGKWLADLYGLARQRLADAGVERVWGGGFCTHRDAGRFFSFRRDGCTGRFASLVWLEP